MNKRERLIFLNGMQFASALDGKVRVEFLRRGAQVCEALDVDPRDVRSLGDEIRNDLDRWRLLRVVARDKAR